MRYRDPLPALSMAELTAAEKLWDENKLANYDLEIKIGGLRPGTVLVEVRDGEVTAMTRDGRAPKQRRTWDVWSVEGQFDTIRRELEMAANPRVEMQAGRDTRLILRGSFDSKYGYPLRFRRMVTGGIQPEVYWEVTRFEAVP